MLVITHWAGMRVGEAVALIIGDVRNADGSVKAEIPLDAAQTKGSTPRQRPLNPAALLFLRAARTFLIHAVAAVGETAKSLSDQIVS